MCMCVCLGYMPYTVRVTYTYASLVLVGRIVAYGLYLGFQLNSAMHVLLQLSLRIERSTDWAKEPVSPTKVTGPKKYQVRQSYQTESRFSELAMCFLVWCS